MSWTDKELVWLRKNSKHYTVKQMSEALKKTRNAIYAKLYKYNLDYKHEERSSLTRNIYCPNVRITVRRFDLGHPTRCYETEEDIEKSLSLEYTYEGLSDREKEIYNATL